MIQQAVLDLLQCPSCGAPQLTLGSGRRADLVCENCQAHYPVVKGIPDLVSPNAPHPPGNYRTETLANVIAGIYNMVAPAMSLAVWRCSPLRYVDHENRALGRAQDGVYLEAPIGTGIALAPVISHHHRALILGVDRSWKMLFKAQKRLKKISGRFQLIRADYTNLPFKSETITSLQSLNGLHGFTNRVTVLTEFHRCLQNDGFFSGSALVRAQTDMADALLERYERYGIYPMLRSPEFLLQEVRSAQFDRVRFETHGAVMFFTGDKRPPAQCTEAEEKEAAGQ